ncbi:MAG: T9SS type A sorting domain-containing protein [Bacteroidetes bacterium]|nr:T9SS type A sorting domain-containing protein [Bacteroidota bacterium]
MKTTMMSGVKVIWKGLPGAKTGYLQPAIPRSGYHTRNIIPPEKLVNRVFALAVIALVTLSPCRAVSQAVLENPVCNGNPIMLSCNFPEGCNSEHAVFHWLKEGSTWAANVKNPTLYPPGSVTIGNGQTVNGSGLCNGEGYGSGTFSLTINYRPPSGGYYYGTVDVSVVPAVAASVTITASANPVCPGTTVTFTANAVNGGTSPAYQWKKNGTVVTGATNSTYSFVPANGNTVMCIMTSNATCVQVNPVSSNTVTMTIGIYTVTGDIVRNTVPQTPLSGGMAYLLGTGNSTGGYDTLATAPIVNGQYAVHTCANSGSIILTVPDPMFPCDIETYLGDVYSWEDADTLNISSSRIVDTIHYPKMCQHPWNSRMMAFAGGMVFKNSLAKANDPIDNVGVKIKPQGSSLLLDYTRSQNGGKYGFVLDKGEYTISAEYPGIPMFTQNGANNFHVYSPCDSMMINLVINPSVINTLQTRIIPVSCPVAGELKGPSDTTCYNALQTLLVGPASFSGGRAYFIAGQKISFLPGFIAKNGAQVWAGITTTGQFCSQVSGIVFGSMQPLSAVSGNGAGQRDMLHQENRDSTGSAIHEPVRDDLFRIWPNPTSNMFTVELYADPGESAVSVMCYNGMGSLIFESTRKQGRKHDFSLAGQVRGIYLVRVVAGGHAGMKKIIKQ